uniref:Galectin n=1 Tax=Panagrolaimus sp. ES5 TaxID=591445 RepID=A0AC34FKD9_9BILA
MWLLLGLFIIFPNVISQKIDYSVPYHAELTETFKLGQTLVVKGKTAEDSKNFSISFHIDFKGKNDIPLQILVQLDKGKVILNSKSGKKWGNEEKISNSWKAGDNFDIRVRANNKNFKIYADRKEIAEFGHRLPVLKISHITVDGDIYITSLNLTGRYYPIPYETKLDKNALIPGKTLLIYGTPEKRGTTFYVNILKKNGDIAFHFTPNFAEKVIIRNSFLSKQWGPEERDGKLLLEKGTGFDLEIRIESFGFQIFINCNHLASFAHRTEPKGFSKVEIGGDVEITNIQQIPNNSFCSNKIE